MSAATQPNDFHAFCDFLIRIRDSGASEVTPEQSVQQFRDEQEKLRRWHEGNAISQEQALRGECGPLDLDAMFERLNKRWAEQGIVD